MKNIFSKIIRRSRKAKLIDLIDKKVKSSIKNVDDITASKIRKVWSNIGPQPSCPSIGETRGEIKQIIHNGLLERSKKAKETIKETLNNFKDKLPPKLQAELLNCIRPYFQGDTYLNFVKQTDDVYRRKQAPQIKYVKQLQKNHHYSLSQCECLNLSRIALRDISVLIEEQILEQEFGKSSKLKHFREWIFTPLIKWVFGILSAILISLILYYFGIKN